MKKAIVLTLSLAMAATMVGCGANKEGTITDAAGSKTTTKLIQGSIKLADYKGLEVYSKEIEVEDSEIQTQIDSLLSSAQSENVVTEGKVVESDTVNIDYVGTVKVDGADFEFEGGSATDYDLDIDNSTFIDGFAEGLVGHKVGDKVVLNLKFPKDYSQTSKDADGNELTLAGKKVVFTVTINSRQVLPELTDDFVKTNYKSTYGTKTVKGLKKYIENQLRTNKIISAVFSDYVDECEVSTYNEEEVESLVTFENDMQVAQLQSQYNTNLKTYLEACKMSEKEWNDQLTESAQKMSKQAMVIEAIAVKEGLYTSEADLNKGLKKVAKTMGYSTVDELRTYFTQYSSYYGQAIIEGSVAFNEPVNQLIADSVKITEGERPEETTTEETTAK